MTKPAATFMSKLSFIWPTLKPRSEIFPDATSGVNPFKVGTIIRSCPLETINPTVPAGEILPPPPGLVAIIFPFATSSLNTSSTT